MAKTIEELLGLPALMGLVEETTTGLPQEKFLPEQFKTLRREVIGNSAEAVLTKGQRKVARLVKYGAPPVGAPLETIATGDWILFHTCESIVIDPVTYQRLRAYESWQLQKQGMEEIGRQVGLFVKKVENLVSSVTMFILVKGLCYFDASGNLLPTSSGSAETLTMSIPAANQSQLAADDSSASIITTPWNVPTANIPAMMRVLHKVAARVSGYDIDWGMYSQEIPGYMLQNSYTRPLIAKHDKARESFLMKNEIPDGFLGIERWIPGFKAFFEDSTGTNQPIMSANTISFMPTPTKAWYELVEGSRYVPTQLLANSVESALSSLELKYGKFIYCVIDPRAVALEIIQGHTFAPTIKVPAALWQPTVVF